jgi:hypothetical protein
MRARSTIGAMLALVLAAQVSATDHLQEARKLTLRDRPGSSSLSWTSTLPAAVLPAQSPTVVGATLRIAAASGERATFDLPASGWEAYQTPSRFQYVFKNRTAPIGPSKVKVALLKQGGAIKVSAKSSGLTLDEASQGAISISLRIGDDAYCSECTEPTQDTIGRYRARACPAPASCPLYCGDGIVNQSFEQCDDPDPGQCANIPPGIFSLGCEAPGSPDECTCCSHDVCVSGIGVTLNCCGDSVCQDTTGFGMVRRGACIPPSCATDADCNGYRCVGGTCCGNAGSFCGVAGCCPDTGTTCTLTSFAAFLCCNGPGAACSTYTQCCSLSCTSGMCD